MATRKTQKNKQMPIAQSWQDFKNLDIKEIQKSLKKFATAPGTIYVAGGIGAALLARFAYRYYQKHPEISQYLKENIDAVEEKLREYRTSAQISQTHDLNEANH